MNSVSRIKPEVSTIIRSVSSVAFGIGGSDPFGRSIQAATTWMRARNASVPIDAETGRSFDVGGGGAPVARASHLTFEEGRIWSAAMDDPDGTHIGRTWITEITVAEHQGEVHFGTRLLNFTRGDDHRFGPSIPRLVRDVIGELPCFADGEMLRDETAVVRTSDELDALYALLERPARRLPVIVLAEAVSRRPFFVTPPARATSWGRAGWTAPSSFGPSLKIELSRTSMIASSPWLPMRTVRALKDRPSPGTVTPVVKPRQSGMVERLGVGAVSDLNAAAYRRRRRAARFSTKIAFSYGDFDA